MRCLYKLSCFPLKQHVVHNEVYCIETINVKKNISGMVPSPSPTSAVWLPQWEEIEVSGMSQHFWSTVAVLFHGHQVYISNSTDKIVTKREQHFHKLHLNIFKHIFKSRYFNVHVFMLISISQKNMNQQKHLQTNHQQTRCIQGLQKLSFRGHRALHFQPGELLDG